MTRRIVLGALCALCLAAAPASASVVITGGPVNNIVGVPTNLSATFTWSNLPTGYLEFFYTLQLLYLENGTWVEQDLTDGFSFDPNGTDTLTVFAPFWVLGPKTKQAKLIAEFSFWDPDLPNPWGGSGYWNVRTVTWEFTVRNSF